MTFCEEVRRETDIYWESSFEHPFIQKLADGTLPLENLKSLFSKSCFYECTFWDMAITRQNWIPGGIK